MCVFDSGIDDERTAATVRGRRTTTVVHRVAGIRSDNSDDDDARAGDRDRQRVHTIVADRILGARRSAAGAQGRRVRGGHRQTVHCQSDPEPARAAARATAAKATATSSEIGGRTTDARVNGVALPQDVSEECGSQQQSAAAAATGVSTAVAHQVRGLVPVHAVQDELGQRLVLRQLQQDERGTVRQQDVFSGVPRLRTPVVFRRSGSICRRNNRRRNADGRIPMFVHSLAVICDSCVVRNYFPNGNPNLWLVPFTL